MLARHSPGPNVYEPMPSVGRQTISNRKNAATFKFGTGDRFSDYKPPVDPRLLPGPNNPGPGTFRI